MTALRAAPATPLHVALERPLPPVLPPGRAGAIFLIGCCIHEREPLARLEVLVEGHARPVTAFAMPHGAGQRSRFWATVPVPAGLPGAAIRIAMRGHTTGGERAEAELGRIEIADPPPVLSEAERESVPEASIAICMATFEPDIRLFGAQVASLRAQTEPSWVCLISDDCSSPERFGGLAEEVAGDPRFIVSRCSQRLGFYRNFERALRMVPEGVQLIALCDQDDRWAPEKLATLRAGLGAAVLIYSDLRLVEADGRVLRETLWRGRANNHTDLAAMLVANTITGAATLFRRELLDTLLPFPDSPGFQFHDHWLAVAALTVGRVAYVDRALHDYVQHGGAVFGHVTHGEGASAGVHSAGRLWADLTAARRLVVSLRSASSRWRAAYFYGYLARQVQAETLLARGGETLSRDKRRALERFVAAERSLACLLWLALRPLRALAGHTDTLGSELELVRGLIWKRLATRAARRRLLGGPLTAEPPPLDAYTQKRLRRWRADIGAG